MTRQRCIRFPQTLNAAVERLAERDGVCFSAALTRALEVGLERLDAWAISEPETSYAGLTREAALRQAIADIQARLNAAGHPLEITLPKAKPPTSKPAADLPKRSAAERMAHELLNDPNTADDPQARAEAMALIHGGSPSDYARPSWE